MQPDLSQSHASFARVSSLQAKRINHFLHYYDTLTSKSFNTTARPNASLQDIGVTRVADFLCRPEPVLTRAAAAAFVQWARAASPTAAAACIDGPNQVTVPDVHQRQAVQQTCHRC